MVNLGMRRDSCRVEGHGRARRGRLRQVDRFPLAAGRHQVATCRKAECHGGRIAPVTEDMWKRLSRDGSASRLTSPYNPTRELQIEAQNIVRDGAAPRPATSRRHNLRLGLPRHCGAPAAPSGPRPGGMSRAWSRRPRSAVKTKGSSPSRPRTIFQPARDRPAPGLHRIGVNREHQFSVPCLAVGSSTGVEPPAIHATAFQRPAVALVGIAPVAPEIPWIEMVGHKTCPGPLPGKPAPSATRCRL